MGNCCATDHQKETSLERASLRKTKAEKESEREHLPEPTSREIVLSEEDPLPSPIVAQILETHPKFDQQYQQSYSDLPIGGPYEYKKTGEVYIGQFKNRLREGFGTAYYPDGSYYEGYWGDGLRYGDGRFVDSEGGFYEGGWRKGLKNGEGKFVSADGTEFYNGSWEEGKRHGEGIAKYGDGSFYQGEFGNGVKNGIGVLTKKGEFRYEGAFSEDKYHGVGKCS